MTRPAPAIASPLEGLIGQYCLVHLRGAVAAPAPVRPESTSANGVLQRDRYAYAAHGWLREVRAGWVRLGGESQDSECWIPPESIPLVERALDPAQLRRIEEDAQRHLNAAPEAGR